MFNIGPQELLLILLVALVVVGPKRLPELSRTIGRGLREFRKAQDEVKKTITLGLDEPLDKPAPPRTSKPAPAASGPDAAGEQTSDTATVATPAPSEPGEAVDVARTLGRGLAEIRRAREEIQRTFRVEVSDRPSPRPAGASTKGTTATTPPVGPPAPAESAPEATPDQPLADAPAPGPPSTEAIPAEAPSTEATPPEPPASASE
jgi:TatA/E family protein of Tat protein translocase